MPSGIGFRPESTVTTAFRSVFGLEALGMCRYVHGALIAPAFSGRRASRPGGHPSLTNSPPMEERSAKVPGARPRGAVSRLPVGRHQAVADDRESRKATALRHVVAGKQGVGR